VKKHKVQANKEDQNGMQAVKKHNGFVTGLRKST